MKAHLVRALTGLAVAAAALVTPTAHASDPVPTGRPCEWVTASFDGVDRWTGDISGGPLAAPGSTVSMRCSIHLGLGNEHSGPAAVAESSTPGAGVTVLEPRTVTFTAGEDEWITLCTEATVGTTTWYWSSWSQWTTDPNGSCDDSLSWIWEPFSPLPDPIENAVLAAACLVLILVPVRVERSTCDTIGPLLDAVNYLVGPTDPVICAQLAALAPVVNGLGHPEVIWIDPESGDTSFLDGAFWDCPPYEDV